MTEQPFDQEFCEHLEYHLSKTFNRSSNAETSYFWCDGVAPPTGSDSITKNIIAKKKITTEAWLGKTGQDKYLMTIKLGSRSVDALKMGTNLINCLPDVETFDWIKLEPENHLIELQLE